MSRLLICFFAASLLVSAQVPARNPKVAEIVSAVSAERIAATMRKLESFGTRNLFSPLYDDIRGVGAAARWIRSEMSSYSPRLEVRFDEHAIKKSGRVFRDVKLINVVAVLPGTRQKDRQVLVTGHYDSLHIVRKKPAREGAPETMDQEATVAANAPGVSDDASGVAAVMELARVLSKYEFEKTLVFVAFSGEEYGLVGSTAYARNAADAKTVIDAVLNNDIIGNDVAGNGKAATASVRIFADEPMDASSRSLARYIKSIGEIYYPSLTADLVFRADRFGRGGDHTPFHRAGFAAVRFTTSAEFYANQHTATDTFANASPAYTARVARLNAAVAASLAWAPPQPDVLRTTKNPATGRESISPNLSRGQSGYDALLKWKQQGDVTDLAGFVVVKRSTLSPYWEAAYWAGMAQEFRLEDVSIDDIVLGVKAIDKDGNESPVSAYVLPPRALPDSSGTP
jgi:hypothetical protein